MKYKIQVYVMSFVSTLVMTACGSGEAEITNVKTTQAPPNTVIVAVKNATEKQETKKIVFLGDSLTAGFGLPQDQAWPEQVQKRLKSAGYKTSIINAGVSGDNSANGLARYDWSVGSAKPDMLVLALGANDFLQGVSPVKTQANLTAIIERAQADGLGIILAGVSTPQLEQLGSIGKTYSSIYPNLAREYNVPLYPSVLTGVAGNPSLLQGDGLHPTREGVEVMADNFTQYISDFLNQ